MSCPDVCSVETITDVDAFVALEADWNDAVARARLTHPFLSHQWLRTWWECFGTGRQLHIVIVRSGSTIVAIAPLLAETAWMYGVPIRRLRLMHNDHTPRADFIVVGREREAYRAIWESLLATRDEWDVLQLGQVPIDSPTHAHLSALALEDRCTVGTWRSSESPYLALTGSWDEYHARLTGKFRQNLRNRIARLSRVAEPALEVVEGGDKVAAACADAIRLEASGWKRGIGTAITSDESVHRFYRVLATRAETAGWLRLLFLTVNGRRIAASYSLAYERRLFLCKTGYDPEFDTGSPFKVLTCFAVRDAFARGAVEVDFLGETEPWKLEWTKTVRAHDWLFVFSGTPRARLLYPVKFQLLPALKRSSVGQLVRR